MTYHKSVLLTESIDALAIVPGGIYVDATFGGGGHTREILNRLEGGRVIAFDQDEDALQNRPDDPRLTIVNSNFRFIRNFLRLHKAFSVDGILADLGISSHQIDQPSRGFSTRYDGDLDMRMDRRKGSKASAIINHYTEVQLADLFFQKGEIRNSRRLAAAIVSTRKREQIESTAGLVEVIRPFAEKGKENKYLAQVFQALRMEVNQEEESLTEFLINATRSLKSGGRLVVISYHSIEDRIVKNYFRSGNFDGIIEKDFYGNEKVPLNVINRKAIVPADGEIEINNRARSARMRIAEKI
jgi:16S rRNA (cytosine1402-N4)-methyltransferase